MTVPWLLVVNVLTVAFAKVVMMDAPVSGLFDLSTTLTVAVYALTVTATDAEPELRSRSTGDSSAPW